MFTITRSVCRDVESSLGKEWLVTNGLGGYASSTIVGANTRRYHGLLVASLDPPAGRTVLLAKIDEELRVSDRSYYLGTNEYQGAVIHPSGFVHLEECRFDGTIPTFVFETREATLTKTVWMEHGRNTTYVRYHLQRASGPATLVLTLLCNYRPFHALTQGSLARGFDVRTLSGRSGCEVVAFEGAKPYFLLADESAKFASTGVWYWHYVYRSERERGYQYAEDLYSPGLFRVVLDEGATLTVIASAEPIEDVDEDGESSLQRERGRQAGLKDGLTDEFSGQLRLAADQFLVMPKGNSSPNLAVPARSNAKRQKTPSTAGIGRRHTIVAGYHWFSDWGRDALISLPGLTLATGRCEVAKEILRTYVRHASDGLMPNLFAEGTDEPGFNAVDVSLWYFLALHRYLETTGDRSLLEEVYPVLVRLLDWYVKGTKYGIKVDPRDGLLQAGENGYQVTWMDAKTGSSVVTPRAGKAVEINALWYNALTFIEGWAREVGEPNPPFVDIREQTRRSFVKRFWYKPGGYLFDVVDSPSGDDSSLRPNQLLAVSLPHAMLDARKAKAVVEAVTGHLLTPVGLRSLAPHDPAYIGRYAGSEDQRNKAYHQGTVWTWLLGPYADALMKVYGDKERVASLLEPFKSHMAVGGLGTVGEIFDGDWPHHARGCIAQAWSVAELLRVYHSLQPPAKSDGVGARRRRVPTKLQKIADSV